jgi:hypothetical protein
MTFYPQCRITLKHQHRLHARLNSMLIMFESVTIAVNYLAHGDAKFKPGASAVFACQQAPLEISVPVCGPLTAAMNNQFPDGIQIQFEHRRTQALTDWASGLGKTPPEIFGFVAVTANLVAPYFVEFYEAYTQFIYDKYGKTELYPPLWRFARVVRNGISHGFKISIERAKDAPVSWYGLTYAYKDNGRAFIGVPHPDMTTGDLLLLMFQMNDLLDEEGVPLI